LHRLEPLGTAGAPIKTINSAAGGSHKGRAPAHAGPPRKGAVEASQGQSLMGRANQGRRCCCRLQRPAALIAALGGKGSVVEFGVGRLATDADRFTGSSLLASACLVAGWRSFSCEPGWGFPPAAGVVPASGRSAAHSTSTHAKSLAPYLQPVNP